MKATCPECGSSVEGWGTCHTYGSEEGGWLSCFGCWSALRIYCSDDDCRWSYTVGLNPGNPRARANEEKRPDWVPEDKAWEDIDWNELGVLIDD